MEVDSREGSGGGRQEQVSGTVAQTQRLDSCDGVTEP